MLREIVRFEWRYHTRQASFVAATLLFLGIGFALAATGFGPENLDVNSRFLVMESLAFASLFSVFAVAIFASSAVLRDAEHRMREIVFTTPVGRSHFLTGRFLGAFLATLTAVSSSVAGHIAGTWMPWVDPDRVAPFDVVRYLWAFGTLTIPNVLFATALLFAIAVLTRNALATYAGAVFLYVFYFVGAALTNSPLMAASTPGAGGGVASALLDPFGMSAFFEITRHWTAAAKSTRLVPLTGVLLFNRVLWIAAAVGVAAFVYRRFSFRATSSPARGAQASSVPVRGLPVRVGARRLEARGPARRRPALQYLSAVRIELRIFRSKPFLLLLLLWLGLAASEIWSDVLSGEYGAMLYPATGTIIATLRQPMSMIGMILLIYYGAEIFWREQRHRMTPIIDTTPVSGMVMIAAKLTAIATIIAAVVAVGIIPGVSLQIARGYFDFQPLVYLSLFYFSGFPLLLLGAAALFIHALSPGKYAGMVGVLLFAILASRAPMIGLMHPLWRFAGAPPVRYTDMNGFGHDAVPFSTLMLHWTAIAILFVVLAAALWRRIGHSVKERLQVLIRHSRRVHAVSLLAVIVATGSWVFYNTDVLNARTTTDELFDWRADYEKRYKTIAKLPLPRVAAVTVDLDLYPEERRYRVRGDYALVNDTGSPMQTVYVAVRRDARITSLALQGAKASRDARFGMFRFDFVEPLAPGGRTQLQFDLSFASRGIEDEGPDDSIAANGSFLMSFRCLPSLGYRRGYELRGERERRRRGLTGIGRPVLGESDEDPETDRVEFTATVSTARDQTAITSGHLEKTWEHNGRRYFRYRSDSPIFNRFAFASARYEVARRRHRGIDVEVYYHPEHRVNVQHMLDVAVTALDYCEASFGPYPSRQLRIVEIPSYWNFGGFAMPDLVFLVEDRSFLIDARDANRVDLVARRVAHEVLHQWWGHRLNPANTEGSSMIVESLTKYGELMVVERTQGRERVRQQLEIELERYLSGRAREEASEPPLYKVRSESYVYYSKGAMVLYAIRDLLGEERLNRALRNFINEYAPHGGRATTPDLLRHLYAVAGEHRPLIDEWVKEITLYDFKTESAIAKRRADGRFDVTMRIAAAKMRGEETPVPLRERIDVAVYSGETVKMEKRELRSGLNTLTFVIDREPTHVVVDPYVSRIDITPGDNGAAVRP